MKQQEGGNPSFPLYTEAIKFINHRDGLVRAAVRTLTLNVYSIREPAIQAFVVDQPASNYFKELTVYLADQCQAGALLSSVCRLHAATRGAAPVLTKRLVL